MDKFVQSRVKNDIWSKWTEPETLGKFEGFYDHPINLQLQLVERVTFTYSDGTKIQWRKVK